MLLSFQPTVIGYACPYVWSGPGHSHPAVELRKAGELIGQLERGQHYHHNRVGICVCYVMVLYFQLVCICGQVKSGASTLTFVCRARTDEEPVR